MSRALPAAVTIIRVTDETPSVRTLHFDRTFSFRPGQFVMVWVPGIDEVPMALSAADAVSVQQVGDATRALCRMGPGDRIGIRGPFGNGFPERDGTLAIAGGIGAAPLLPLARTGSVGTFLLGARTACEVPFRDELAGYSDLIVATDDGSAGEQGPVTTLLDQVTLENYPLIAVCGPEKMMRAVWTRLREAGLGARGAFSLHRYMKCGIGVCGSCCLDPGGERVCTDGPVFGGDRLEGTEFGEYRRDSTGGRIPL
jgi:dihydroorotate dehydrogenase electron transfer subunit